MWALTMLATAWGSPKTACDKRDPKRQNAVHKVVFWVPNRVLDALDPFRLRVRVGPGLGLGARATETVDAYAGAYWAAYAGLPGPRNRVVPKMPIGLEMKTGIEVSKADVSTGLFLMDPDYGKAEFGVSVHALLLGVDIGFDPVEAVDFVGGIFTADLRCDDI